MAHPRFMVDSAEAASCWEQLRKILQQEYEKTVLNEIQESVDRHKGLEDLIQVIAEADGSPALTMDRIKSNLGLERSFDDDIKDATEAYNIAVCRAIGPAMYRTLPRELRDMVYEYLTPCQLNIDIPFHLICEEDEKDFYVLSKDIEYRRYFPTQPRSHEDELCPEHYWRDEIISREAAHELMETWYRNNTLNMTANWAQCEVCGWQIECLNKLLNNDRFRAGLQPRELITKFAFELIITGDGQGGNNVLERHGISLAVDSLFLLPKATQIQVIVEYICSGDMISTLREFLIFIRPAILRVLRSGYRCTVVVTDWLADVHGWVIEEWQQELEAEIKGDRMALSGA